MAPRKNRAQRLADLEERPVKDYDPEGDASQNRDESGSDSEASEDGLAGTEHYVAVGKSRLRQREEVPLGPQYRGAKISRADLEEMSDENDDDDEEEEDEEEGEEEDEEEEEEEDGDSDGGDSAASSTEFADPDKVDLDADQAHADDAEIESDNAFGESDAERFKDFKFRASKTGKAANGDASSRSKAADFFSSDEDRMGHEQDDGDDSVSDDGSDAEPNGAFLSDDDEEASEDGTDASDGDSVSGSGSEDDEDDEKDDEESGESAGEDEADAQRAELRRILSEGQKSIMATVSQAAKADAAKGVAVRQQRRTFDALLHLRIRLQKALVAANSFGVVDDDGGGGSGGGDAHKDGQSGGGSSSSSRSSGKTTEPYQAAEEAAIKLWNAVDGFRRRLLPESVRAKAGEKRKWGDAELGATEESLWERMQETERLALAYRRKVLDKWSARVRSTVATTTTRRLGPAATSAAQPLSAVLDDQLLSADRLVQRARTPRSCAPAQAARKVEQDPAIYDDADFYQLLLKELVDQRSLESLSAGAAGGSGSGPMVRWAALKEAKTRRQVDRRASKGRKLRYTVHEKLQNFMAPEDRRTWEQEAIDRFFATLFGQKMELAEEVEQEATDDEMGGAEIEAQGLRLFRS